MYQYHYHSLFYFIFLHSSINVIFKGENGCPIGERQRPNLHV